MKKERVEHVNPDKLEKLAIDNCRRLGDNDCDSTGIVIAKQIYKQDLTDSLYKYRLLARTFYDEKYYYANDEAHRITHADDVYATMVEVDERLKLNLDKFAIVATAYIHDIFTTSRDNHHELASEYVMNTSNVFLDIFNNRVRKDISEAVYEHRSSGDCKYSNLLSLAIQIADTGEPSLLDTVRRSFKYHIGKSKHPEKEVLDHMRDKFSRTGYGFKCDFYRKYYKKELDRFFDELDDLTIAKIKIMTKDIKE